MKRERLRRFVAWQYASKRTTVRAGSRQLNKIFIYMGMQQKDEKKFERYYSEERVNAALGLNRIEYMHFRNMLDQAHILLDNTCLAQLAIYEPRTFESIVNLTRKMSLEDGRDVLDDDVLQNVEFRPDWLGDPLPRSIYYQKGPAKDFSQTPRKLRVDEF
ncbi:unnamed protein product [Bursaphelenchus xylophilus]|uniref:(pine wood nematode) hypothetical protein n=1 Tax=Bursaphelenchus xylophilus TaxID=6326 RepID=A0A1I7SVQ0_BURXY|nr:unnamed protein product [Bursaphelenchus xylophilus]CAG9098062.1 unnamed protein product [Bursaphelenchus xylophilus]